ncbi:MAG: substrate-binding domain-containing protein, partial [Thermogemmatispora sp.]
LVGFDDNPASAHVRPALTTVRQPVHAMGEQAIKLLLEMIEQEQMPRRRRQTLPATAEESPREAPRIVLPTSLVIRESCGALQRHPSALLPEI